MDLAHFFFQAGDAPAAFAGNSLRFRGAQYLSRTNTTASADRTKCTFSCWVKRGAGGGNYPSLFNTFVSGADQEDVGFDNEHRLNYVSSNGSPYYATNNAVFRDYSAWYNVVFEFDSTESSSLDRAKVFVNGQQVAFNQYAGINLNYEFKWLLARELKIGGTAASSGSRQLDGYMAEVHFVDGQALEPTEFGEFNDDGVWVPKTVSIDDYGTNGFYLDFSDPDDIGADRSGNGNNWTATGFELANSASTNYDWMADSPTQNYATLNPLTVRVDNTTRNSYSLGNLRVVFSSTSQAMYAFGTHVFDSGSFYFECQPNTNPVECFVGIRDPQDTEHPGTSATACFYGSNGSISIEGVASTGATFTTGDIIGVAVNKTANTIEFFKNNVSQGSFNMNHTGKVASFIQGSNSADYYYNAGNRPFRYDPPAGFEPLQTQELPAVTITNPSEHFQTVTYQGTGTTNVQSTPGLKPGLVWIKKRSGGSDRSHQLFDTIRGGDKYIHIDDVLHNQVAPGALTFLDEGFSVNTTNDGNNSSGNQFVAWCWSAPETITNAAGTNGATLDTTVHRNKDSGFAIIEFTGNKQSNTKLYHGLGKAPKFMYFKTQEINDWWVAYHANSGALDSTPGADWYYEANTSDPRKSYTLRNMWDRTDPDDNLITLGATDEANRNGGLMIAYAWAEVPGYSAFGSYTGNGSTDGPFIYTGFKPAFVLFKSSTQATNWYLLDNKRGPYNEDFGNKNTLYPDRNVGEDNNLGYGVDFLSNGFKPRSPNGFGYNNTGQTYIYAAFAEHPFGGSNVSPTTAR